ncbi:MAG: DUF4149 domain-containing protein [Nitrospirae bacterium]|nr:DUF4149 domain-containing protein [Nitrospirota bacterium]
MVFVKFLFLMSLTVWFGSLVFFSFVGAPAIFKTLPREQAGNVVGVIFPKYYLLGIVCGLIALGCLMILSMAGGQWSTVRIILLVVMIMTTLYAGFVLSPKARDLNAQIRVATEEGAKKNLQQQFSSLHRQSVTLNSVVLLAGVAVVFLTAVQLKNG